MSPSAAELGIQVGDNVLTDSNPQIKNSLPERIGKLGFLRHCLDLILDDLPPNKYLKVDKVDEQHGIVILLDPPIPLTGGVALEPRYYYVDLNRDCLASSIPNRRLKSVNSHL